MGFDLSPPTSECTRLMSSMCERAIESSRQKSPTVRIGIADDASDTLARLKFAVAHKKIFGLLQINRHSSVHRVHARSRKPSARVVMTVCAHAQNAPQ